jgi:FtsP/CotA-like multicopper oxidase with cupredoxin domain
LPPFFFLLCSWCDSDFHFSPATQGILINGQFPGPQIDAVTNDNIIINVFNNLPAPFLLSW